MLLSEGWCFSITNDSVQTVIFATDGTTKTFFIVYVKKVKETAVSKTPVVVR